LYNTPAEDTLLIKAWGFTPVWRTSLCSIYDVLPVEVKIQHLMSATQLSEWLESLPFLVYQNTAVDLNGDGVEDRLIYLETSDQGELDSWVFFMTADGYDAKYINSFSNDFEDSEKAIYPLEINSELNAFMLLFSKSISINFIKPGLQIEPDENAYAFDVRSYKVVSQTQPAQIIVDVKNQYEQRTLEFFWDDLSQSFMQQDSIVFTQSQIEKVLYVEQDYPSVINRVDTLLANSNFESNVATLCGISVADDFCVDFPKEYAAYFFYMRALSFEQMGLVNDARDAYYQLWQKYPQNLFGIIASKKLEPVQP